MERVLNVLLRKHYYSTCTSIIVICINLSSIYNASDGIYVNVIGMQSEVVLTIPWTMSSNIAKKDVAYQRGAPIKITYTGKTCWVSNSFV